MDFYEVKEQVYTKLLGMHGFVIEMLFHSLGLSFSPLETKTIYEIWGSETKRMIQIELISIRLVEDEVERRKQKYKEK